jgi:hypothetical protein
MNCPVLFCKKEKLGSSVKGQHSDVSWNQKRKQTAINHSRMMRTKVEQMKTEQEALVLHSPEEMDAKIKKKINSTASVVKDEFWRVTRLSR